MATCSKNTNYDILNSSDQQIRDIALSSDGKTLEINLLASGNECTFSIYATEATGLKIVDRALQIVDALDGLTNVVSGNAASASVKIEQNAEGRLEIIGINDVVMSMQANIRYDAATDTVIMHY